MSDTSTATAVARDSAVPLVVDLDGTLLKSDLLLESCVALLRRNPWYVVAMLVWVLRGKAHLKTQIAARVDLDVATLPYDEVFVSFLKAEAQYGRRLILATASARRYAVQVAQHLGIFAEVLATTATRNLSGAAKGDAIRALNGAQPFDYAANSAKDLPIWRSARHAIVVNASSRVCASAQRVARVERVFKPSRARLADYARALRGHQWLKNLLLCVPLLTAHQWGNGAAVTNLVFAFFAFSFCASGVYVLNDLFDLAADRAHPRKRLRPFAAGVLSIADGALLIPIMFAAAVAIALTLPRAFFVALLAYLALSTAYSLVLKRYLLVDVLLLAGLYTLRVIAGASAIDVELSFWLLAFSVFLFFSLALVKRCTELRMLRGIHQHRASGRDYRVGDRAALRVMGMATGYLAVLVFALFINSPEVSTRYSQPQLLWFSCPALLYWISRVWVKEGRGEMHDDPLIFALRDPASYIVLLAMLGAVYAAL